MRSPVFLGSACALGVAVALGCAAAPKCGEGTVADDKECVAAPVEEVDPTPTIGAFTASVEALTEGESVTFTATATDPQGPADLVTAELLGGAGALYGTFTSAGGDTWTLTLSWLELHGVNDIDFGDEENRTFVARFADVSGREATAEVAVRLHCDGLAACDAVCTDLTAPETCGTCDHACAEGECHDGACRVESACIEQFVDATCDSVCLAEGWDGCLDLGDLNVGTVYETGGDCADGITEATNSWDVPRCTVALADYLRGDVAYCACADR